MTIQHPIDVEKTSTESGIRMIMPKKNKVRVQKFRQIFKDSSGKIVTTIETGWYKKGDWMYLLYDKVI